MSTANASSTGAAPVVALRGLTKRFGEVTAVDDLTYEVQPGRIVGLLGRNGAGKTTSLRMLLGLCRPTSGEAAVFGRPYAELPHAARRVGVSMDAVGPLPGASARRELTIWARTLGLPKQRVEEVLELVGLADGAASRPVKGYSTGMKQRLALATALLPDPELLVLDEPANGLDPDGIRWLRGLLRGLADEGRTVLVLQPSALRGGADRGRRRDHPELAAVRRSARRTRRRGRRGTPRRPVLLPGRHGDDRIIRCRRTEPCVTCSPANGPRPGPAAAG